MFAVLLLCLFLQPAAPLKTTLCEITGHPGAFDGKLVQVRSVVESGVDDLPAALTDDSCGAQVKFFTPDDEHFARLVKSKAFRKLTKDVMKKPVVEATVTGWFKRTGTGTKPAYGLALESVEDVSVKHPAAVQKR